MYSKISEVKCWCPACDWIGVVFDCEPDVDGDGSLGCPNCNKVVITAVDQRPIQKWISVKDRLPEKGGRFLVYIPDEDEVIYACIFYEVGRYWGFVPDQSGWHETGVTHWMPLPEPP